MAVAMALFWISLVLSVIGSNAAGEFSILHSPDSLKFSGSGNTLESLLKEIFSAALGLSVEENSEWKGMYVTDPFNTPEAVVEVYIDGVSTLGENSGLKSKTYSLTVDEFEPDTYPAVEHRIKQRFTSGGNKLVNIKLSNRYELESNVFGEVTYPKSTKQNLKHLKPSVDEDNNFLDELETLQAVIKRVQSGAIIPDNIIDFIYLRFRSLHPLCDFHGLNSLQAKEAKKLLGDALQDLNKAFVKAYDGSVLVTVVTTDVAHTRRHVRSVGADGKPIGEGPVYEWNVKEFKADNSTDDSYNADYPAIFNIILWFVVVMVFTLIAIVYALIDMDPGRDSIIYRMTSTRMKKDN